MAIAVNFDRVGIRRDQTNILQNLNWQVKADQRWVILGPNGSGKTTALKLAGAQLHPSSGSAEVLGHTLGRVDLRQLRMEIGFISGAVMRSLRNDLTATEVVITGKNGALDPIWHKYETADFEQVRTLLFELGVQHLADRPIGVISEGERQQILLARALISEPKLLLLDEPFAGLDLGAREMLLERLTKLISRAETPPSILVTHHAEEIPRGVTHAGLLRDGNWVATGPVEEVLDDVNVSECFGLAVKVSHDNGRWSARRE